MRTFKLGLVFSLLLSLLITSTTYANSYFPDVSENAVYAEAVNSLYEWGIVQGDEQNRFNPNKTITRAEFAAMMCRMVGEEESARAITRSSFSDVPSSHWACGYVTRAVQLGMVNGYGNGKFGPSDTLTYEQAVKVLVSALGFEDEAAQAGGWPNGYIDVAKGAGITKNTTVNQKEYVVRSTVALLVYNTMTFNGEISSGSNNQGNNSGTNTSATISAINTDIMSLYNVSFDQMKAKFGTPQFVGNYNGGDYYKYSNGMFGVYDAGQMLPYDVNSGSVPVKCVAVDINDSHLLFTHSNTIKKSDLDTFFGQSPKIQLPEEGIEYLDDVIPDPYAIYVYGGRSLTIEFELQNGEYVYYNAMYYVKSS